MTNTFKMICSPANIKHCCEKDNALAKCIVPNEWGCLDDVNGAGEYIQWLASHMMAAMIQVYQSTEVAKC